MNINDLVKQNNLSDNEIVIISELVCRIQRGEYKIPIRDIAELAYVSTTSVVRFAKKLGYESYSEMLFRLKQQILASSEFQVPNVIKSSLLKHKSIEVVDEFVNDIISGNYSRIHLVGIGYSQYICDYFSDKLNELDFHAYSKSPLDFVKDKPSLVVFISESGETADLLFIEKRCFKLNAKMYAMSSDENSTLCKHIRRNIIIQTGRNANEKYPDYFFGNSINLIEGILAIISEKKENNDA